jgi:hypothetical protein
VNTKFHSTVRIDDPGFADVKPLDYEEGCKVVGRIDDPGFADVKPLDYEEGCKVVGRMLS